MTFLNLTALKSFILQMHHSVSHVSGPEGGSLASFLMVDISYHGDILMSPDTRVNLKVIYPDEYMEGFEPLFS